MDSLLKMSANNMVRAILEKIRDFIDSNLDLSYSPFQKFRLLRIVNCI